MISPITNFSTAKHHRSFRKAKPNWRASSELHDTNFARIAEACGITGIRVEKASEVDEALQRAFSIDGPVLVDVVVAKEELAIPPQIKLEQAKGFSLYMLRAIISGRGDEVIELAKTNWLR